MLGQAARRRAVHGGDMLAAGVVASGVVVGSAARRVFRRAPRAAGDRRLLALETDYSLHTIRQRGLEQNILARDLEGFFDHVWSVYPFAGASPDDPPERSIGRTTATTISDKHTMIEGKVARFARLHRLPTLNFALAQAELIRYLDKLVRQEGISLVRASEPFYMGPIAYLLARLNGIALVVRLIANYDSEFYRGGNAAYPRLFKRRSVEKQVGRMMLRRADLVAAGNQNLVGYALDNGARQDRVRVFRVGNLIEPVHFLTEPKDRPSVRGEWGLDGRPLVVMVCRLAADKHPEDLPSVIALVKKRHGDIAALLIGDGALRASMEEKVVELGLVDNVILAGQRTQPWIANALSSADVVVSPVTGRALIEACLSGTPVVAYDTDWQSELISSGETGILVPFRDTHAMADAVCKLLGDPTLAASLGRRSRACTLTTMDPAALIRHERDEYQKLLRRGKPEGTGPPLRR